MKTKEVQNKKNENDAFYIALFVAILFLACNSLVIFDFLFPIS